MKWLLAIIILTTILVLAGATTLGWASYELFLKRPSAEAEAVELVIEPGEGVNQISRNLKDQGLLGSMLVFETYVWLIGSEGKLQAGVHELQPGMPVVALTYALVSGSALNEVTITIPEGYTLKQIGEVVTANFDISSAEWEAASAGLEGYLFPDTYRFFPDATAEEIVGKMRQTMDSRIAEFNIENVHETLTLASIIEREVRDPEDMKLVADIFLRRLSIGMALQADSTVNYVTGGDSPAISLDDRDIDSPYNTYKYPGLPPGPISNPGLPAIGAAIAPKANDYWYFLTTPEGEVIYAATYEEHLQNKQQYLR